MSSEDALERALKCLGRGFDVACDFRPEHCRGGGSLLSLQDGEKGDFATVKDAPADVKCDKGGLVRFQSDVLEFSQMSEAFNRRSSITGRIPSGLFNHMFDFDGGEWARDASDTKLLAMDGLFITLFELRIQRQPLALLDHVVKAVPRSWDPLAMARFIEKYGTHTITGVSVGGQDVVYVKQEQSSSLSPSELKHHLDKLGDELFTGACPLPPFHCKSKQHKLKTPEAFNVFDLQEKTPKGVTPVLSKDGVTVMCCKRGGDTSASSHSEWLPTVTSTPDVINFTFIPITSLLRGVPGNGFLSHAVNLYLRYKPPLSELRYFLEFQSQKLWAPMHHDLPLGPLPNRSVQIPALNFTLMGPKLYVNTRQVIVGGRPVTGMRLHLEGKKSDRLAVHLEHLAEAPAFMATALAEAAPLWRGSDAIADERYYEPVQWKKSARVCTAPVEHDPRWRQEGAGGGGSAFIVNGARLHVASGDVLHLGLLYAEVRGCTVSRSRWRRGPSGLPQPGRQRGWEAVVDSGVILTEPPAPVGARKMLKLVDTAELSQGPQNSPGHWLVTGAKLEVEKGKIRLHVKFSLLASLW